MDTLWTALLGAIQGATEFLPVSSSGHLAFSKMLLSKNENFTLFAEQPLVLEILLHLATLLAVIIVYRKEAGGAITGGIRAVGSVFKKDLLKEAKTDDGMNLAVAIILGTLPTGIIGFLLKTPVAGVSESPVGLGISFMACALLLFSTKFLGDKGKRLTWKMALIIGIAQGFAIFPGISRSGTTIAVALALGISKSEAAKFSFLLSIPAILGAAVMELDLSKLAEGGAVLPILVSTVVAFLVGLAALKGLIKLLDKGKLWAFSPYLMVMGIVSIVFCSA